MLSKTQFEQMLWIIARSEQTNFRKRGPFAYYRPISNTIIDIHNRASGIMRGIRAVQTPHIMEWIDNLDINLNVINQWQVNPNLYQQWPSIGIEWNEFDLEPMSNTVHTVLHFLNQHRDRKPVRFPNDFWYYEKIISHTVQTLDQLQSTDVLVLSLPFFSTFKPLPNMNQILQRCSELGIPVALDCVWLPLVHHLPNLQNTDCVELVLHSMTKTLPLSGIKGGIACWRKPSRYEQQMYPLGGKLGAWVYEQYLSQLGYYHVRDHLKDLQSKWCSILDCVPHDFVYAGEASNFLKEYSLHHDRIFNSNLICLVPFFENDSNLSRYLTDQSNGSQP